RASHSVGGRQEAVLNRLRDQHHTTGNITGGEDMGRGAPQVLINLYEAPLIGLYARRSEAQPGGIGSPSHGHDHQRRLSATKAAILRKNHPNATRHLFKKFDSTEVFVHYYTRLAEGGGDR